MRLAPLLFLLAISHSASAQVGDILDRAGSVLWIAHQFEGLDATARVPMAVALGTTLAVPALALASAEAGVPIEVALPVALLGAAIGPEAGFVAAGIPRAGLTGTLVRAAAVGGTAVLLLNVDLTNAGLGAPAVVLLAALPGAIIVTASQAIDQARLRDRLREQSRARQSGRPASAAIGLVRGGPGVRLLVPIGS